MRFVSETTCWKISPSREMDSRAVYNVSINRSFCKAYRTRGSQEIVELSRYSFLWFEKLAAGKNKRKKRDGWQGGWSNPVFILSVAAFWGYEPRPSPAFMNSFCGCRFFHNMFKKERRKSIHREGKLNEIFTAFFIIRIQADTPGCSHTSKLL